MYFMWDSNVVYIAKDQSWNVEFVDYENLWMFELKLITAEQVYDVDQEDGRMFEKYEVGEIPYFLFDYCKEVIGEVGKEIKEGKEIIDFTEIIKRVRYNWLQDVLKKSL